MLFVLFLSVSGGAGAPERSKRQAPSINVHQIPKTGFSCTGKKQGDYYADPETNCQVYHVCVPGMYNKMSLISFVCPNGTIFNQASRVCTPYDRVDCKLATKFYGNVHGNLNNGDSGYGSDSDFDNYVPQPPRAAASPPARAPSARQQPPAQSSRNTIPPPPPQEAPAPQRTPTRFRTGTSQFRQPQARPAQTPPQPATAPPPPPPARQPVRAPVPAIRPPIPVPGARPAPAVIRPAVQTTPPPTSARPTVRSAVSTSTSGYTYEYEYEYDYEDETPEQPAAGTGRRKRDASAAYIDYYEEREDLDLEREPKDTKFTCKDKVAGGVYSDIETDCEMFHICIPLSKLKMVDYKLYCANGKGFDQETGSCREKSEFKCEKAQSFYLFDKLNQSMLGKKPIYKKSSYTKSKKSSISNKE